MTMFIFLFFLLLLSPSSVLSNPRSDFELTRKCINCNLKDFVSVNSNFTGSLLANSNLRSCNLSGSVFDYSTFDNVLLDDCSLQNSSFKDVDLMTTSLKNADIAGADFLGASVLSANFLSSVNWQYAKNFSHINIMPTDLFKGALDLYSSGDFKQSLVVLDYLISHNSVLPSYLHLRSALNLQLGDADSAIKDMLKSSDLYSSKGDSLRAEALIKYSDQFKDSMLSEDKNSSFDPQFMTSLAGLLVYFLF